MQNTLEHHRWHWEGRTNISVVCLCAEQGVEGKVPIFSYSLGSIWENYRYHKSKFFLKRTIYTQVLAHWYPRTPSKIDLKLGLVMTLITIDIILVTYNKWIILRIYMYAIYILPEWEPRHTKVLWVHQIIFLFW